MAEVIIENEQDKIEIDKTLVKTIEEAIDAALKFEGFTSSCEVSVTITDNEEIRKINREHREIDSPTDVLSFPMLEFDETGAALMSEFDSDGDNLLLGDIVISAERAREQAEEFGHSLIREFAFLTVHSMLHLLGYDHINSEEEEKIMFGRQEQILSDMGITRDM